MRDAQIALVCIGGVRDGQRLACAGPILQVPIPERLPARLSLEDNPAVVEIRRETYELDCIRAPGATFWFWRLTTLTPEQAIERLFLLYGAYHQTHKEGLIGTPLDMMRREIAETYTTPEMRAAYRAGMSMAAAICNERAAEVIECNPGRRKGTASIVGAFGASVARGCGGAILDARNVIRVREDQEPCGG